VLRRRPLRVLVALSGVVLVTYVAYRVIPMNATTVGFAYLLLILIVASTWGFLEAALASVLATLVFNFFFLPPVGTFTIAGPGITSSTKVASTTMSYQRTSLYKFGMQPTVQGMTMYFNNMGFTTN